MQHSMQHRPKLQSNVHLPAPNPPINHSARRAVDANNFFIKSYIQSIKLSSIMAENKLEINTNTYTENIGHPLSTEDVLHAGRHNYNSSTTNCNMLSL